MPDNPATSERTKRSAAMSAFAPANIDTWMSGYRQTLETWMRSGDGALKRAALFTEEIMDFSRNRFQADLEAWDAIASCRSPADFVECQRQYVQKASSDYLEEANKLTTGMMAFLTDVAAPLRQPPGKF